MVQSLPERFRFEVIQVVREMTFALPLPSGFAVIQQSNFGVFGGENRSHTFLSFYFCVKIAIFHSLPAFTRCEHRGPVCVPVCVHVCTFTVNDSCNWRALASCLICIVCPPARDD